MFTAKQVANHHGTAERNVKNRVCRDHKPGPWAAYVTPGTFDFIQMPPPFKPTVPKRFQKKGPSSPRTVATQPLELISAMGSLYTPRASTLIDGTMPAPPGDDIERRAWALYWINRGLAVQPAEYLLGSLIYGNVEPLRKPSDKQEVVERMWSDDNFDADIACWPDNHGMFVIEVCHQCEEEPDFDLEEGALIINEGVLGDRRYWYAGRAYTKLHALGRWVHVIGIGRHSYLPPSAVPGYCK